MKTPHTLLAATILVSGFTISSCRKNAEGGEASIHARIVLNDQPVIGSNTVYVKFNATEQPSDPKHHYDMKVEGEAGENHVHIEGLCPGKYFLYAEGFDSASQRSVHGGCKVKISWSEKELMKDALVETVAD